MDKREKSFKIKKFRIRYPFFGQNNNSFIDMIDNHDVQSENNYLPNMVLQIALVSQHNSITRTSMRQNIDKYKETL